MAIRWWIFDVYSDLSITEGMLKKDKSTRENIEFWEFVEKTAKDVAENFPAWKKGGYTQESPKINERYNDSRRNSKET